MKKAERLLILFLLLFISCGDKKAEIPEKSSGKVRIEEIRALKTKYVGDNSKVLQIVNSLYYEKYIKPVGIEIQSNKEPYALKIRLSSGEKLQKEQLYKNSVIIFSLIENLSEIEYNIEDSEVSFAKFSRREVEERFQKEENAELNKISESANNMILEKYFEGAEKN